MYEKLQANTSRENYRVSYIPEKPIHRYALLCHKLWYESVSHGIDVSICGASVVREQLRNHGTHVDPVASSSPLYKHGVHVADSTDPYVSGKKERRAEQKEIRTRQRGGFDRRKVGQETISPFSADKYFMRFNPASVSSSHRSSLFSFIKPSSQRASLTVAHTWL